MVKKIALITGASSGLGKAMVKKLAQKEITIYITARRKKELEKIARECVEKNCPAKIKIISGDISKKEFRERLVKEILKSSGRIDYLINNAGFGRSDFFENMDSEIIENMFEVNIIAYMHLTSLVLKDMKKRDEGRIIHVGSVVAFTPLPFFTAYNSTKSAVYAFNRSLRYELKDSKISSTVVLPARMKTGFADVAYECMEKNGKKICVDNFNKIAGSPEQVADFVIKKLDSGKEVLLPTFKSFLWYTMRYFGFAVDFVMKNFLGPKEAKDIKKRNEKS